MNRQEKLRWYKKEFENISKEVHHKDFLSYSEFLRIRNFKLQNSTVESQERVKEITSKAFELAEKDEVKEAIQELIKLDGVAIPIASTILAVKYPDRYAIIDVRVLKSLNKESWVKGDKYKKDPKIYESYISLMKKNKPSEMSLRDYERSLFEKQSPKSS